MIDQETKERIDSETDEHFHDKRNFLLSILTAAAGLTLKEGHKGKQQTDTLLSICEQVTNGLRELEKDAPDFLRVAAYCTTAYSEWQGLFRVALCYPKGGNVPPQTNNEQSPYGMNNGESVI